MRKILLVDDDSDVAAIVHAALGMESYLCLVADNGESALQLAKDEQPDLILLDVMMPGKDGFSVIRELKANEETRDTPIIFLSALGQTSERITGLNLGASDFISKPFDVQELIARIQAILRQKVLMDNLREVNATLNRKVVTDELTGLFNRRFFQEQFATAIKKAAVTKQNLSCLMMDLDHFKQINDSYGHLAGDAVLSDTAGVLQESTRIGDILARYGGEEFIMLLPDTPARRARKLAERLRTEVEHYNFRLDQGIEPRSGAPAQMPLPEILHLTLSIGLATWDPLAVPALPRDFESLAVLIIERADAALYRAKREGRNRVRFFAVQALRPTGTVH